MRLDLRSSPPPRPRVVLGVLAAAMLATLLSPADVWAKNALRNGAVSHNGIGTTDTEFVFTVEADSDGGPSPGSVRALVGDDDGTEMELAMTQPEEGGAYRAVSRLPAGEWEVTFVAEPSWNYEGPPVTVIVTDATPAPTAAPTASPTPQPTPSPTEAPTLPPTPGIIATARASATAPAFAGPTADANPTPGGEIIESSSTASPSATDVAATTVSASGPSGGLPLSSVSLLFLGGAMLGTGAAYLGVLWMARRARRRTELSRLGGRCR